MRNIISPVREFVGHTKGMPTNKPDIFNLQFGQYSLYCSDVGHRYCFVISVGLSLRFSSCLYETHIGQMIATFSLPR